MSTRRLWTSPFSPTLSTIFLKLELTVNAPFVFLQWRRRLHVIWTRRFPILANEYAWRSTQILQERVRRKCKQRQGTETLRNQVESKRDTSAAGESRRSSKTPLPSTSITRFPQPPSQLLPFSSPSETLASAVPLLLPTPACPLLNLRRTLLHHGTILHQPHPMRPASLSSVGTRSSPLAHRFSLSS